MLKRPQEASQINKKHVRWDKSAEDNEGKTRAKRQKTEHVKRGKGSFSLEDTEQIKASIKRHFSEGTYGKLEEMLNKCSLTTRIKILSVDNYELFIHAASGHNIKALNFIIRTVPQHIAYNMVHKGDLLAFENFLIYTRTLEKLGKLDRQNRIEGFKIFLKIDHESVQKAFNGFEAKLAKTDTVKDSVRKDFTTALTQLKKEGVIQSNELNTTEGFLPDTEQNPSKNDLLNHLEAHNSANTDKTNLTFHSTIDHAAFDSMTLEENVSISGKDISNLTETAKKVQTFVNVSNPSYKIL
jgi:hypothetical protein